MDSMPEEVHKHFWDGEHTVHHTSGLFNGIWSNIPYMAIESIFMRYGQSRGGFVGITLKPETLTV